MEDNAAFDLLLKTLSVLSSEKQDRNLRLSHIHNKAFKRVRIYVGNRLLSKLWGYILNKTLSSGGQKRRTVCHNCSDGMAWKLGSRRVEGCQIHKRQFVK